MTVEQIASELASLRDGEAQVIVGRAVLRERGGFIVEGHKNRLMGWNVALDKLARRARRINNSN